MDRKFFAMAIVIGLLFSNIVHAATVSIGTGTSFWGYPFATNYHDARTQSIYLSSEIGDAKQLNLLALYVGFKSNQVMNHFTIRLKHTDLSAYGRNPLWQSSGWTTVYQADQTISTTGWVPFIFTVPFEYNGTQNLMVDISFNNSSYTSYSSCRYTSSTTYRTISYRTNSYYGDPLIWTGSDPDPDIDPYFADIILGSGTIVTVPNVVGITREAAQVAIASTNLSLESITEVFNDFVPAGDIIYQSPTAGVRVSTDFPVSLGVSLGQPVVPDVVGMKQEAAETEIIAAGLYIGNITQAFSDTVPAGTVLDQSLTAGTSVSTGSPVDLIVSLGWSLEGQGTGAEPYRIQNIADMQHFASLDGAGICWGSGIYVRLETDLDLTGIGLEAIGTDGFPYNGIFNGNGHQIAHLTMDTVEYIYSSLFGNVGDTGIIMNLALTNVTINGFNSTGGLVGFNFGSIINCYSTGTINGSEYNTGGLAGSNYGVINNCYSSGMVNGYNCVGGLAGYNGGSIISCYATNAVSSFEMTGGLVGYNDGSVVSSFWDTETSGQTVSAGGAGKTTAEMQTLSTFISEGWDFSNEDGDPADWNMNEANYPELLWRLPQVVVPQVSGVTQETAQSAIKMAILAVGGITWIFNDSISAGTVMDQSPAVGTLVNIGSAVDLVISLGGAVTVPDVTGMSQTNAQSTITSVNLWIGSVSTAYHSTIPAGYVINQSPIGGQLVPAGAVVRLVISLGCHYSGGTGTLEDPYLISTPYDLNLIGSIGADWNKYFKLVRDIDMSGYTGTQYRIIGRSYESWFTGTFDGNNHKIRNLTYLTTSAINYVGLFGYTFNATIKNLGLENVNISTGGGCAGGLIGYQSSGMITNCYSTGSVTTSATPAGGLVGGLSAGTVTNCYSTASINVSSSSSGSYIYAGGLVGGSSGTITNSWSTGNVIVLNTNSSGLSCVGGIVGLQDGGTIDNCTRKSALNNSSALYAGGIVGCQNGGIIINCCNIKEITASLGQIGGIVGLQNGGGIGSCCNAAPITCNSSVGTLYVGGMVGYQNSGSINNSFNTGSIRAVTTGTNRSSYVGGIVGEQFSGYNSNCYNTGAISASSNASACLGGLAGTALNGAIQSSYSTGSITATSPYVTKGGLVGYCYKATISSSFWDTQTSGCSASAGGTGKTTAQMQTQSTFTSAGWDFVNTWHMNGYPVFKWEINPLQAQIDAAANEATIVVQPGLYKGRLYFKGKNITLTSVNPQDSNIVITTIIQGTGVGSVINFAGTETSACVLRGFNITGGNSTLNGGGVNGNNCSAVIQNCRFYGNAAANVGGGIWGVHGLVENCFVYQNTAASYGGGIGRVFGPIRNCLIYNNQSPNGSGINNCDGAIENCTIVSSQAVSLLRDCDGTMKNCIFSTPGSAFDISTASVSYSCWPGATGKGNISADPMFADTMVADPNKNVYHLLADSPCMDAGDPSSDYSREPLPNGGRIDMGAYGNTPQATLSRNVLLPLGFQTISKTRVARTAFEYELAVVVRNPNAYDMTNVQLRLKDMDAAVTSVLDDAVTTDAITSGVTVTSTDTFKIVVDRSQFIVPGMLTWDLTYYVPGGQAQQAMMSMALSMIDTVGGDITGDGSVNLEDFAVLAGQWNTGPGTPSADIALPLDGYVGIEDLMYLAENWMN